MISLQSLTQSELALLLEPLSRVKNSHEMTAQSLQQRLRRQAKCRAQQIFHWVYQRFQTDWDQMTDLSQELREWLKQQIQIIPMKLREHQVSEDKTQKFLWTLEDGKTIESVLIPAVSLVGPKKIRWTGCLSSQVGCAMGCQFCLTGVQGLDRHLSVHEIVGQVFEMKKRIPLTNLVFMGMGEPLHNFESVVKACEILLDSDSFGFSKRKITISTSGLVPAIDALGQRLDVSLAISLHATTQEQRVQIMPISRRWHLDELIAALKRYPLGAHRRITIEYILLKDFNDTLEDAQRLTHLFKDIPVKINLIPFNEYPGAQFQRPHQERVLVFQKYLINRNFTTTVRSSRGRDILAACGQLKSELGTVRSGKSRCQEGTCQQRFGLKATVSRSQMGMMFDSVPGLTPDESSRNLR